MAGVMREREAWERIFLILRAFVTSDQRREIFARGSRVCTLEKPLESESMRRETQTSATVIKQF